VPTPPSPEDNDRQLLPTLRQGYAPPKPEGLQQDQTQTCVVAPMATPTTNRILQKQQPLEILYTGIRDQTGLALWENGDREAAIYAFRGRPAFEGVTDNETSKALLRSQARSVQYRSSTTRFP
jgi:hypothetical protein